MNLLSVTETRIFVLILGATFLSMLSIIYYLSTIDSSTIFLNFSSQSSIILKVPRPITPEDLNYTYFIQPNQEDQKIESELDSLASGNESTKPSNFHSQVLDTERLTTPKLEKNLKISNSLIKCTPKSIGFSDIQVSIYFPQRAFKMCKELNKVDVIQYKSENSVEVKCPSRIGTYFISSPQNTERLGRIEYKPSWESFESKKEINLGDREFIMVKCSNAAKGAWVRHQYNEDSSKRSRSITKSLIESLKTASFTPFSVNMIILDSVSRPHFFRSLKNTIDYLNSQLVNSKDYVVYDFINNNANGENTRPNLVALLLGRDFNQHLAEIKGWNNNEASFDSKYLAIQNTSLWKHYERMGYVTLFEFDTIWNFFCDDIGRQVYTDSKLLNFWNAAKNVFSYTDFIPKPRCFGSKNGHWFLFEYLRKFNKNYKGHNKFTYTHTSIAHENTGKMIKTLDDDLKEGIESLVKYYKETKEDFLIVLASDHGRRVQEWDRSVEGIYENKHPFHLIITKQSVIKRLGKQTHEIITHNTERLISRYDWYLTLQHLAMFPYGNLSPNSYLYQTLKTSLPISSAVSVFLEKIPDNRTCEDVNIKNLDCLCRDFVEIDSGSTFIFNVLEKLALGVVREINKQISAKSKCRSVTYDKVFQAFEFQMKENKDGGNRMFKFRFGVKEDVNARIEVYVYAADPSEFSRLKIKLDGKISIDFIKEYIKGYHAYVESFKRVDLSECTEIIGGEEIVCIC